MHHFKEIGLLPYNLKAAFTRYFKNNHNNFYFLKYYYHTN